MALVPGNGLDPPRPGDIRLARRGRLVPLGQTAEDPGSRVPWAGPASASAAMARTLLEEANLAVDAVYGWFDRHPHDGNEDMIFVTRTR